MDKRMWIPFYGILIFFKDAQTWYKNGVPFYKALEISLLNGLYQGAFVFGTLAIIMKLAIIMGLL